MLILYTVLILAVGVAPLFVLWFVCAAIYRSMAYLSPSLLVTKGSVSGRCRRWWYLSLGRKIHIISRFGWSTVQR